MANFTLVTKPVAAPIAEIKAELPDARAFAMGEAEGFEGQTFEAGQEVEINGTKFRLNYVPPTEARWMWRKVGERSK